MSVMTNSNSIGLIIVFMSIFSPICVQSEEIPARGPIPFTVFDEDDNGFISEKEFNTVRGERMATRVAEGRPMRGAASAPSFAEIDANGDGQLTRDELAAKQQAQMEQRRGMGMGSKMPGPGLQ